jgi:Dolichyl-phosphate-mannose-protein mannosyltransferase
MGTESDYSFRAWRRDGFRLLLLAGLTCSLFSGTAALLLVAAFVQSDFHEPGLNGRLLIKGVVFLVIALGCLAGLRRSPVDAASLETNETDTNSAQTYIVYGGVLLLFVLLLFPKMDGYPWTAPDELHHLVVAKNLAVHHAYASGHPDTGFEYFDPYDSVGPSVLVPVAVLFNLFGVSVSVARWFEVASLFLLAFGVIRLLSLNGYGRAAPAAAGLLIASFGSVYLSRSLYGEVPALAYLVWGLVAWHRALANSKPSGWSYLAGVFFALAVLAKMFMFIGAFALAAVYLADLVRERRIRWHQVVIPAGTMLVSVGIWWGVVARYTDSGGSMAVYYRHYLMFGFDGFREGLQWFSGQPLFVAAMLIALTGSVSAVSRANWSPPLLVLLMAGVLYGFWWLFFTPGTLPRYLWYTCAVLGVFASLPFTDAVQRLRSSPRTRLVAAVVVTIIAVDAASRLYEQADLVYLNDQAADERGMVAYLEELPADTRIATTYWPAELSMNFMASRVVTVVPDWETGVRDYDVVILNRDYTSIPLLPDNSTTQIGRYVIVSRTVQEGIAE